MRDSYKTHQELLNNTKATDNTNTLTVVNSDGSSILLYKTYREALQAARISYSSDLCPIQLGSLERRINGSMWYSCEFAEGAMSSDEYNVIATLEEAVRIYNGVNKLKLS